MMQDKKCTMRQIPSIDKLLEKIMMEPKVQVFSRELIVAIVRKVVEGARQRLKNNESVEITAESLLELTKTKLLSLYKPSLRKVINGTGIVLHTNLGRAPLGERAIRMVNEVMGGYSTLEYNVDIGERGSRYTHVVNKICALTGAEDAIVVNNNAAAVLLVLSVLAKDREVIVSRGQLVEIGGSFRVPDVLRQSGGILKEVGTTNKTHLRDYEDAINEQTGLILKVHTSNYRVVGFTAQPGERELIKMAHGYGLPVVDDLGSGTLQNVDQDRWHEPTVGECLAAGIDIVTFSSDKLLGAGQGGIIAGKKIYIEQMKKHPLLRAIRIDKLSLAALEGTMIDYLIADAYEVIPVQQMLKRNIEELREQAEKLASMLQPLREEGWQVQVVPLTSQAGGGTLPEVDFTSFGISLEIINQKAANLEKKLRNYSTPIIVRIQGEKILFDVRCLTAEDMNIIQGACMKIGKEVCQ